MNEWTDNEGRIGSNTVSCTNTAFYEVDVESDAAKRGSGRYIGDYIGGSG